MNLQNTGCIDFLGIKVSVLTIDDIAKEILRFALTGRHKIITYLNAHCVNISFNDEDYKRILNLADIVYADGKSIVWASFLLKKVLPERFTSIEYFDRLIGEFIKYNISFYFLGCKADIVIKVVENLKKTFHDVKIKGFHNGYFDHEEERKVINEINKLRPHILMVGMGVPKQEKWVYKHLSELDVNLCWIVGGTLDNLSGVLKRPPKWMSNTGFAWLYRLFQEPKRLRRRYLIGNLIFIYNVLKFKIKNK